MVKSWKWRLLRRGRRGLCWGGLLAVFGALAGGQARASVAVLLEQPYGKLGRVDPAGHSAIYLDHVCAETPVKLRVCRPGELGVVISRYDGIEGYDWLAMPLVAYLYGVETADQIPDMMDKEGEIRVRDAYRRAHLESVAPDLKDGSAPQGNWYELVGSAYDRTIYGFSVKTTAAQDVSLIALMNDRKNKERYNGLFVNCADFDRVTINRFYPHAVSRNFVADLGLSSPKSVARGLSHYATKHPEVDFKTFVVPQVPGTLPRSHSAVDAAEGVLRNYAISLPLVVLSPTTAGVVLVAYLSQGRFDMPKDAPLLDLHETRSTTMIAPVAAVTPKGGVAASAAVTPSMAMIGNGAMFMTP